MWRPDTDGLASWLTSEFGLEFEASSKPNPTSVDWPAFELRPSGVGREISFAVEVVLGWRSISFTLLPGAFAGPLVQAMGELAPEARSTFLGLAEICLKAKGIVFLSVNGAALPFERGSPWPSEWQRVSLSLAKSPAVVNTEDEGANNRELELWCRRFISLALSLMPFEDFETDSPPNPEGLPEGAKIRIETNRYERSQINRAACLELQGYSCLACDFNFGRTYGEDGEGFIHVHHVVPVSQLGPGYRVNPATDLVPLCPNCHAMAHRFDPPASVEQLRRLRMH